VTGYNDAGVQQKVAVRSRGVSGWIVYKYNMKAGFFVESSTLAREQVINAPCFCTTTIIAHIVVHIFMLTTN
jgi:hypothetical protein